MATVATDLLLEELCADLRLLWSEAGGPTLRDLSVRLRLGKTQVGAILSGHIRRPPQWQVVRGLVVGIVAHAHAHHRTAYLSRPTGVEEFWRPRHAVLEHVFGAARCRRPGPEARPRQPGAARVQQPRPTPRQLPTAARRYAARADELDTLTDLLGQSAEAVVVATIDGAAGIGKTALAVRWAHQVSEQFPDGQLFADLRGFTPEQSPPVAAADILSGFLDAWGVPPAAIPSTLDARAALYRSVLAGRRVLVVLDNAHDVAQVRPVLPGTPGCMAVVTSRTKLAGLVATEGAHPITLGPLTDAAAHELLTCHLGAERVAAEPAAVAEIVAGCGGLSLALTVVAARAAHRSGARLADLADDLRVPETRLDALDGGDPHTDVRAALTCSYRRLSSPAARLFRLLGRHRSATVDLATAARVGGLPAGRTRALIAELVHANVVGETAAGRYTLHELSRAFAGELPPELPVVETSPQCRRAGPSGRVRPDDSHPSLRWSPAGPARRPLGARADLPDAQEAGG